MSDDDYDWHLPLKADMHVHLEGAAPPSLVRRVAARHGEPIDGLISEDGLNYRWSDFTDFLVAYDRVAGLFRTAEDYRELTHVYLGELGKKNCLYTEIIVSPDHAEAIGLPADDYLAGIAEGIRSHAKVWCDNRVETRLIATGVRHRGVASVEGAARTAARWRAEGPTAEAGQPFVVGFGLAGDERVGRPRDYTRAFDIAREAGLRTSCHAGEVCGPQSVRDALDHLRPDRIDHGVRAIEDAELVRRLAGERTMLAVSIGSNLALGVYSSLEKHPVARLAEAGCMIALGSDDPPFFGNSILSEYAQAGRLGLDPFIVTRNAIEGAFCDTRTMLRLASWHDQWRRTLAAAEGGDRAGAGA